MTLFGSRHDVDALVDITRAFVGERLALAREAAGLDIKDVAERVGTTSSAISQLEHRTTKPKTETLLRLAFALGVPPAFFATAPPPDLPVERCHFRRLRSAPAREQRQVRARGRLVREIVGYLEEVFEFPADAVRPLQRRVATLPDIEALAQAVRDAWGLGLAPLGNVVGLLEAKGVIPVEVHGHSERLDAFSVWVDDRAMVFLSIDKGSASRRRFDAAHELGHLAMHWDLEAGDATLEREADQFAAAFLMPRDAFLAECPVRLSWPALRAMKVRWGTSLLALVRRAHDCERYSDATYRRAHVQYAQQGWRRGEPDEPPMEHPRLVADAVAQLEAAGQPATATAAALRHGPRLFEDLVWPRGRAA